MEIVCQNDNKSLVNFLLKQIDDLNYANIQKILRKKDIKINGKRIGKDTAVAAGDKVEIFGVKTCEVEIVYQNDDILVANKPANIEVVSDSGKDLCEKLIKQTGQYLFAVHRLDRNTKGLVVFAKNLDSKNVLEKGFKEHKIKKYYLAITSGIVKEKSAKKVAYLKKDSQNSFCKICDQYKLGYSQIITNYKLLKRGDLLNLLEVEIETGKTHQIRAHLSHIGLPILGDEKYGDKEINRQFGKKKQMLVAYKLDLSKVLPVELIELKNIKEQMEKLV